MICVFNFWFWSYLIFYVNVVIIFVDLSNQSIIQQSNSRPSESLNCSYQWPKWFLQQECFIHFFNYIMYMQDSLCLIYNNVNVWLMLLYYILWLHFGIQDTVIHFIITRWAALVNLVRLSYYWWHHKFSCTVSPTFHELPTPHHPLLLLSFSP
jgi:hypothetical protein